MKSENIKPTGTNVLIKYLPAEKPKGMNMVGGIYIPEIGAQKANNANGVRMGIVLAVGNGKNKRGDIVNFDVKVGDSVLCGLYNGIHMVCEDGAECCLIDNSEIIATVKE